MSDTSRVLFNQVWNHRKPGTDKISITFLQWIANDAEKAAQGKVTPQIVDVFVLQSYDWCEKWARQPALCEPDAKKWIEHLLVKK